MGRKKSKYETGRPAVSCQVDTCSSGGSQWQEKTTELTCTRMDSSGVNNIRRPSTGDCRPGRGGEDVG